MPFALVQTVAPTDRPLTLDRAKSHLRVSWNDDDAYIADLLDGAIVAAQRECGLQFIDATYRLILDGFPSDDEIRLPIGPVDSVSSITYTDTNGAQQTVDSADYYVGAHTGRIWSAAGWPVADVNRPECVVVEFVVGFGNVASSVPKDAVSAILLILADRFQNRGDEGGPNDRPIPPAALRLLNNLRNGEQW